METAQGEERTRPGTLSLSAADTQLRARPLTPAQGFLFCLLYCIHVQLMSCCTLLSGGETVKYFKNITTNIKAEMEIILHLTQMIQTWIFTFIHAGIISSSRLFLPGARGLKPPPASCVALAKCWDAQSAAHPQGPCTSHSRCHRGGQAASFSPLTWALGFCGQVGFCLA